MYEWLKDYQRLSEEIDYLEYKLISTERELKRWEGGDLSEVKLVKESNASKLEEIIEKIKSNIQYKTNERDSLIKLVETFTGLNNQILRMKYIENKTLYEIALDLNFSVGYIQQRHAEIKRTLGVMDEMNL